MYLNSDKKKMENFILMINLIERKITYIYIVKMCLKQ